MPIDIELTRDTRRRASLYFDDERVIDFLISEEGNRRLQQASEAFNDKSDPAGGAVKVRSLEDVVNKFDQFRSGIRDPHYASYYRLVSALKIVAQTIENDCRADPGNVAPTIFSKLNF